MGTLENLLYFEGVVLLTLIFCRAQRAPDLQQVNL